MASGRVIAGVLGIGGAIPFVAFVPQIARTSTSTSTSNADNDPGGARREAGTNPIDEGKRALGLPTDRAGGVRAQLQYGASIVSFLGAVHWGLAVAEGTHGALRLGWGVMPSIGAWLAMSTGACNDEVRKADALAGLLGTCYVADAVFTMNKLLPQWYMSLRTPLTIVAIVSLYATRSELERTRSAKDEMR